MPDPMPEAWKVRGPEMKVLHVYRTYFPDPPGGLQEAIRQIALASASRGIESRIFALSPDPEPGAIERPEGLVMRARSYMAPASCDLGGTGAFSTFRQAVEWADVIHYHFPWPFADLLRFAGGRGKPSVMTYHSDVVGKGLLASLYNPLMNRMLASMDAVVATSPAYARTSPPLAQEVEPEKLQVIPLGIVEESYDSFRSAAAEIDLEERFGLSPNGYFLFVGVLRKYKGLEFLVEAARSVDLPVVIAGSGPEHDRIAEAARSAGNIRLVGQVDDAEKMALIAACRTAVLPSHMRSEAFGVFLIEAAMCGRPMISCEIGTGTSYVNKDLETGIVVSAEQPGLLAEAMQRLERDDDLAANYGLAARARYERLFSGESLGRAYGSLYQSALG